MSKGMCNFLMGSLLDHAFLIGAMSQASHLYVGLSLADPGPDGSGISEPSGGSYARVQNDAWTRTGNSVANSGDVTFPTATGDWGDIAYAFVCDASSGGNFYGSGPLTVTKTVSNGDPSKFPAGSLNISLSRT